MKISYFKPAEYRLINIKKKSNFTKFNQKRLKYGFKWAIPQNWMLTQYALSLVYWVVIRMSACMISTI